MTIKLAILKTGENIISDIKEGFYEDKLVCYILQDPCAIAINGSCTIDGSTQHSISLSRWPLLSKDKTIELPINSLVLLVEPVDNVKSLYVNEIVGNVDNE